MPTFRILDAAMQLKIYNESIPKKQDRVQKIRALIITVL